MMKSRTLFAVLAVALPLSSPAFSDDVIGEVEMVNVWAYGTPPDSGRRDLRANQDVHAQELIETVKTGEILIEFEDGTTLGMGSESATVLGELVYDRSVGDSMVLTMSEGFFHFVTGDIAPEAVTILTPAMIIGIRGTDIAVGVDPSTTELGVRSGTATATSTAGGATVDVGAGQTASASVDRDGVSVSSGLSSAAAGAMPGQGGGAGGSSAGGGGRGGDGGGGGSDGGGGYQ